MPFNDNLPGEGTDPWYSPLATAWANLKSFVNGLETALSSKASQTDLTNGLAAKVNTSTYTAGLAGKADLVGGVVPSAQLPAIAITEFLGSVNSQAAMLALTGQKGDWAIRSDNSTTWIITGDTPSNISSWTQVQAPTGGGGSVASVNGETGIVVLTHTDVGAASAAQGSLADTAVQPDDLSTVATSGAYGDLTGQPTLGTAAAEDTTAFATAAQGTRADNAVPSTRMVNGKALSANVTLSASDVGARDDSWVPTPAEVGAARAASTGAGLWIGTQAAYNAIVTKDATTLYITTD